MANYLSTEELVKLIEQQKVANPPVQVTEEVRLKTHKKFKINLDIVIEEPEVVKPQVEIPVIEKPWWDIFVWCSGSRKEKKNHIDVETQTNISLEDNKK
mgnify:CR=1 FL=1